MKSACGSKTSVERRKKNAGQPIIQGKKEIKYQNAVGR